MSSNQQIRIDAYMIVIFFAENCASVLKILISDSKARFKPGDINFECEGEQVQFLMKTIAIGSFFVLFAIASGMVASPAFADHPTATVSTPAGTSVPGCEATNECYIPYEVTVDVGGEVTWTNDDTAAHTVTAGSAADGPSGVFDSNFFYIGTAL